MKGVPFEVREALVKWATHAPAANTDAVCTLAAEAGTRHALKKVWFSYDADPAGSITIVATVKGVETTFKLDVTVKGVDRIDFSELAMVGDANTAITITLAAGGQGVTGKLVAMYR